ncbi:MAG: ChaN family lipoprotein [Phycisphaerales bacterium]|nr:ChaN family lipoprotein [Phycisphaerales bacterium]
MQSIMFAVVSVAILLVASGCGRERFFIENDRGVLGAIPAEQSLSVPREMAMFAGDTGKRLAWTDLRDAMVWADVILVGEQHDDAAAHRIELELVRETIALADKPGVSMEMLERNEQGVVDEYLSAAISQKEFVTRTGSANWGGKGKWGDWYHPIVDAARDAKVPLIAANSPRKYVKEARVEGYGVLWAHPPAERKNYFIPERILGGSYADRFMGIMTHHSAPAKPRKTKATTQRATTQPARRPMPRRKIDPREFFRAQLVWDATMAGSIAQGLDSGLRPVIHIVGQFHTDFDGGTVQYLLDRKPDLKILTISLQNAYARDIRPADKQRADVVIYTLAKPPEDKKNDSNKSAD